MQAPETLAQFVWVLMSSLDGLPLNSWGDETGVINFYKMPWAIVRTTGPPGAPGVPRGPQLCIRRNRACNRVKQGVQFKEAPRVLNDLVLKETSCKIFL